MKKLTLSTKILVASVFILIIFFLASFGILFRALSNQSIREMDQLLKNDSLSLSALVNSTPDGNFEFEIHPKFPIQYHQRNPNGFFKFIDPSTKLSLKQSEAAPEVQCFEGDANKDAQVDGRSYRIKTFIFTPELDSEGPTVVHLASRPICLVVGIDREPYWNVVKEMLWSSIPILISIVVVLIMILLILIQGLTSDLTALTNALKTANFGATHAFPALPTARTEEVRAIVEVLEDLHEQASGVYREMWLFMGRAAHQIKTPVTAMQATLEVLLRRERTKEELLAGLVDVQSAAGLLNGLTRKLILSSRISYQETPPTESINLRTFLNELVDIFKSKAIEHGVNLRLEADLEINVVGNRTLMSDIFGNLIENALLYSPEHKESSVTISWRAEKMTAIVEIADEGLGFPDEIKSNLFKPFFRGDERKAYGSGLGLSIAKKSAQLLGGDIDLARSNTHGSTMRVWLIQSL